jgi:hypothetical protein
MANTTEYKVPDRLEAQESVEHRIALYLMVSNEYAKQLRKIWQEEYMESPELCKVCQWLVNYWDKYGTVPGSDVETLYMKEIQSGRLTNPEAELIYPILQAISERWERSDGVLKVAFYYQEAEIHFKQRQMELHSDAVKDLLEKGRVDEAILLQGTFKPLVGKSHSKRADEITALPVRWLWEEVLARDELNLLIGDPFMSYGRKLVTG